MIENQTISVKEDTSPQSRPLEALVLALKEERAGALEAFIAYTRPDCYRLALSILRDQDLACDALQDAYFIVYRKIGQLRESRAVKGWLLRIVTHCCHDISRKRQKVPETGLNSLPEVASESADPAEIVERRTKVHQALAKLPEIDRTALALRAVCSMSYREMSQVLKIPLGTVRSRLSTAKNRFIAAYKGENS